MSADATPVSAIRLFVEEDLQAVSLRAAEEVVTRAKKAISDSGRFTWVLSGGATPSGLYSLLGRHTRYRDAIDWKHAHFFWADERHVGPEDSESNYRMARDTLLAPLAIPPANAHRIQGELSDATAAALLYEEELRTFFGLRGDALPRFDLVTLGIGVDGHTASLFPGSGAVQEQRSRVIAPWVDKLGAFRITLSLPVLCAARAVMFLVAGEAKAGILRRVLDIPGRQPLPSQLVRPTEGELLWLVDRDAGSQLSPATVSSLR